jgi:hypothetical protein
MSPEEEIIARLDRIERILTSRQIILGNEILHVPDGGCGRGTSEPRMVVSQLELPKDFEFGEKPLKTYRVVE